MDSRRAEAFSDGVFAVAITVLVFNLLGIGGHDLTAHPYHVLLSAWPEGDPRTSRIVFITQDLPRAMIEEGMRAFEAAATE